MFLVLMTNNDQSKACGCLKEMLRCIPYIAFKHPTTIGRALFQIYFWQRMTCNAIAMLLP
jgi:hypothetical protein